MDRALRHLGRKCFCSFSRPGNCSERESETFKTSGEKAMSLYKTQSGHVSHADAVPFVESVPSRRQAISAFIKLSTTLSEKEVDGIDEDLSVLRDFLWSR